MSDKKQVMLSPVSGICAWVSVLITCNITSNPIILGAAFISSCTLALAKRQKLLIVIAVLSAIGMCLVQPGISFADGSFSIAYAKWSRPDSIVGWVLALATTTRVSIQVLAISFIMLIPANKLLAVVGKVSSEGALLAGMTSRMKISLIRDVSGIRDELANRGLDIKDRSVRIKIQSLIAIWESVISGILDRAFDTAAALRTRGFRAKGKVTAKSFTDTRLMDSVYMSAVIDGILLVLSISSVSLVIVARKLGYLSAPALDLFGGFDEPTSLFIVVIASIFSAQFLLPLIGKQDLSIKRECDLKPDSNLDSYNNETVISIRDLSVRYPSSENWIFKDLNFSASSGELIVFIGNNGCGKSTLLNLISGISKDMFGCEITGDIEVAGSATAVFQIPEHQILMGSVAEEVAFSLRYAALPIEEIQHRVINILSEFGVLSLAHRSCLSLSGGELQCVLLAAALISKPRVVVLDEPTSQLDKLNSQKFWSMVNFARQNLGVTFIVAEHNLLNIDIDVSRCLEINNGKLIPKDSRELKEYKPILVNAYKGRSIFRSRLDIQMPRLLSEDLNRVLLRDIHISANSGSVVAVEGENGSGKSTLLRAIRGFGEQERYISIDKDQCIGVSSSIRRMGWVGQTSSMWLTGANVLEAVIDTSLRLGLNTNYAIDLVRSVGMVDKLLMHPIDISVGERQVISIISATAHVPTVWLLDEPTRGMDSKHKEWLARYMINHSLRGGIIIFTSHDENFVRDVATHRMHIEKLSSPFITNNERGMVFTDTSEVVKL